MSPFSIQKVVTLVCSLKCFLAASLSPASPNSLPQRILGRNLLGKVPSMLSNGKQDLSFQCARFHIKAFQFCPFTLNVIGQDILIETLEL